MRQEKIDYWGWTDPTAVYTGEMARIQHKYQQESLQRLRDRLSAAGIPWDYETAMPLEDIKQFSEGW